MPVNKLSELKRGASAAPEDVVIDIEGGMSIFKDIMFAYRTPLDKCITPHLFPSTDQT